MAVDYSQCEAMQRAITRITGSRNEAMSPLAEQYFKKHLKLECGEMGDSTYTSACIKRLSEAIVDYPDVKAAMYEVAAPYELKIEKVQRDYEKAGCY